MAIAILSGTENYMKMVKNHEIRFRIDKETLDLIEGLWEEHFYELKKSHFYERVWSMGFNRILLLIKERDPELLKELFKRI